MKVVAPTGAARRRLGLALASQTPLQFRFPPRRGALRAKSPKAGELCVAPRRGGVGSCLAFPKRAKLGLPTPRPMGLARVVPQETFDCPFAPSGAGRLLRLLRQPLMYASRFKRTLREQGTTRAARPPKTERGNSKSNKFTLNLPRSVFRLRRALRPYPLRGTRPRTANRRHRRTIPPRAAYATLRLFSRQVGSPRTLKGHSVWGARIFPRVRGTSGTRPHTMTGRGAARGGFGSAAGR